MDARLGAGLGFVLMSFALNSVITRALVAGPAPLLDPVLATTTRFAAGAAALALLMASRGRARAALPRRANLAPAAWLGAYAFLISYGYVFVGAAAGTLAFYACVLLTMTLWGALREGERPRPAAWAGAALALLGVGVLGLGRVEGAQPLGVLLLALTGVSWGAYSVLGRRSPDALAFTAGNFAALGAPLAALLALLLAGAAGPLAITAEGLLLAAAMGALTTALSYVVWYAVLARIDRLQGATAQLAIPVLAALLGVALLGEPATPGLAAAGALVVGGMALAARAPRPGREP